MNFNNLKKKQSKTVNKYKKNEKKKQYIKVWIRKSKFQIKFNNFRNRAALAQMLKTK